MTAAKRLSLDLDASRSRGLRLSL